VRIVLVDNYDSFTWNLVELLSRLGAEVQVVMNDERSAREIATMQADAFVISPGPCSPTESGASLELVRIAIAGAIARPLLGVCLGHQALAHALGGRVERARRPLHGKTCVVEHDGRGPFSAMPSRFDAARYNSLIVAREGLPKELEIAAWDEEGAIMALRHTTLPLLGVQFHPESFLTPLGPTLVDAWLAEQRSQGHAS
jgi:anthranilate synthase/aminodeoxychorismate synthase-like glutamine amidotransferase